ncbi:hypothetical protein Q4S45_07065 [Massilia sp. R2A-15]|uniref:MSCRAMM family protein n=1 Tax=Massilia sp. R2A-15 TaxID=3064278 RepID=UPI002734F0F5|nr:hypothetical protein [Massilia sp. R2A-15]WLI90870.1 hypothetical protein Q4S45_07065 [Massilia sp. R2A-15]
MTNNHSVITQLAFIRKLFVTLLALLLAAGAFAQGFGPQPKDAPNLVLLEVRLDEHSLSDSLTAYQFGDDVFLPLGELSKLLTIAIRTQPAEGRASGYILDEQRGFSLDVIQREVNVNNQREVLDRAKVKLQADDIYVASRVLSRWLPVDLDVEMSSLTLRVKPREKLPLQAGLERKERGKRGAARGEYVDPDFPRVATPYRKFDTPFIDQTLGADVRHGGAASQTSATYTAYLTGDLAGLEAELYANRNLREGATDLRWSLGRNDPDARLLGPLRARTAMIGSVPAPGVANIAVSSATGDGATLSNRPLNQPNRFDRHSLQGDLPPGWDVELYFNDGLVAFQQSRPDGKYSFADLPLVYGANEFRLVFHGPLGQLRVERQSFLLEQSMIAPGQAYYSMTRQRDESGHARSVAQFDWGLTRQLSANGGLVRLAQDGKDKRFANLGLHGYLNSYIVSADLATSDGGGQLAQVALKTQLFGLSVGASHAELKDFSSELYLPSRDPIRSRDELQLDGSLPAGAGARLPVSLQVQRDRLASDAQNIELSGRVSAYKFGTSVTNALRWQSHSGVKTADGLLQASRRVAGIGVSGQLQYNIEPHLSTSTLAISADKYLDDGYLLNVGVQRGFQQPEYRITAGMNKSLGSFGLGVNGYYSSRGEYGVGVQLFVAMGLDPRRGRWITEAQPMAPTGAASVRVFLDKNQNGVMDPGEQPLEGAGFTVNGGGTLARTGPDGIAYLNRLPVKQNVDIGFDVTTLEDPQLAAQQKGFRVVPRPGKVSQLDFAVSVTGEIDGTTYMLVGGERRAVGSLELELVDASHKVVGTARSASDGYFVMSSVLPGNYILRLSKEQLKRLDLSDMGMHLITISPDGNFVNGRELYVEANPK